MIWTDEIPDQLQAPGVAAVGLGKGALAVLMLSPGKRPDMLVLPDRKRTGRDRGRRRKVLHASNGSHRLGIEHLIPRDQWPPTMRGCGANADPLVAELSLRHVATL